MRNTLLVLLAILLLFGCKNTKHNGTDTAHEHASGDSYTCPMHPQVIQRDAGSCPICGMDLVKRNGSKAVNNDLMLNDSQIKLANIKTEKVGKKEIGHTVAVNGRLTVNEQLTEAISSRAAGRIEKLYIKETGQLIKKGDPLYTLYSETLLTLQQEYLLAKEQYDLLGKTEKRYKSFLDASQNKLLLYGLTKTQIGQLDRNSTLQPRVTFLSPSSGMVREINASEGQYVQEGGLLYTLEDLSELWVEAELYPGETSNINIGDNVTVSVSGNNETIEATITFISPEYIANSQITVIRASLKNTDYRFKPGQQAQVYFMHSTEESFAVPVDAVIRSGKGTHLYVQAGHNTFKPRLVKTGVETFDLVQITEGINEDDTVVISGAYLLYSEMILKKGVDPIATLTN